MRRKGEEGGEVLEGNGVDKIKLFVHATLSWGDAVNGVTCQHRPSPCEALPATINVASSDGNDGLHQLLLIQGITHRAMVVVSY